MLMKAPRLGDGFPEIQVAEEQHEYLQVTAAPVVFNDGTAGLCTRWAFTEEERAAIARGEDLYVLLLGTRMQPISMTVGKPGWAG